MTRDEWKAALGIWSSVWPDRALSTQQVAGWYRLMSHLDGPSVIRALHRWALDPERTWPPKTPGEIIGEIERGPDDEWEGKLAALVDLVKRHGYAGGAPEIADPVVVEYVRSFGGWQQLCQRFDGADSTTRAQFRDFYQGRTRHKRREEAWNPAGIGPGVLAIDAGEEGQPELPAPTE